MPASRGWGPLVVLPAAVLLLESPAWPRWALMWALAAAIYAGCKWLTWRQRPAVTAPWWLHAAYLAAWPGMDAAAFLGRRGIPRRERPSLGEWAAAVSGVFGGAALFRGAGAISGEGREILAGWAGMTGVVLMLHFGVFQLASSAWRALGIDAKPLMDHPLGSSSVSDFWGRRWNTAFRDLTHTWIFRPLAGLVGARSAIVACFASSGLVHDFVISLPAGGGHGGPTAYFAIQGLAFLLERSRAGRAIGLARGRRGWAFALLAAALPAPLLFHAPFVRHVFVPFMEVLGAVP